MAEAQQIKVLGRGPHGGAIVVGKGGKLFETAHPDALEGLRKLEHNAKMASGGVAGMADGGDAPDGSVDDPAADAAMAAHLSAAAAATGGSQPATPDPTAADVTREDKPAPALPPVPPPPDTQDAQNATPEAPTSPQAAATGPAAGAAAGSVVGATTIDGHIHFLVADGQGGANGVPYSDATDEQRSQFAALPSDQRKVQPPQGTPGPQAQTGAAPASTPGATTQATQAPSTTQPAPTAPSAAAPAPSEDSVGSSPYAKAVAQVESAGGTKLKNPNPGSTSSGLYGFLKPTADAIDKKYGLDPNDPDIENQRLKALTQENAKALGTDDPRVLYAAHNSGVAAVKSAQAKAESAGHPEDWPHYLVTPTGRGNSDPLQGQKALAAFDRAYAKENAQAAQTDSVASNVAGMATGAALAQPAAEPPTPQAAAMARVQAINAQLSDPAKRAALTGDQRLALIDERAHLAQQLPGEAGISAPMVGHAAYPQTAVPGAPPPDLPTSGAPVVLAPDLPQAPRSQPQPPTPPPGMTPPQPPPSLATNAAKSAQDTRTIGQANADTNQAYAQAQDDAAKVQAASAKRLQDNIDARQQAMAQFQSAMDQVRGQLGGGLNPMRLFSSTQTQGGLLSGVAIALGALGSAITGQKNPALELIEENNQREIANQRLQFDREQAQGRVANNAYGRLMDSLNDQDKATAALNSMLLNGAAMQLRATAARTQQPAIIAQADLQARALEDKGTLVGQEAVGKDLQNRTAQAQASTAQVGAEQTAMTHQMGVGAWQGVMNYQNGQPLENATQRMGVKQWLETNGRTLQRDPSSGTAGMFLRKPDPKVEDQLEGIQESRDALNHIVALRAEIGAPLRDNTGTPAGKRWAAATQELSIALAKAQGLPVRGGEGVEKLGEGATPELSSFVSNFDRGVSDVRGRIDHAWNGIRSAYQWQADPRLDPMIPK